MKTPASKYQTTPVENAPEFVTSTHAIEGGVRVGTRGRVLDAQRYHDGAVQLVVAFKGRGVVTAVLGEDCEATA